MVPSPGGNSRLVLQAQTAGSQFNGATIAIQGDPGVIAGQETVTYDPTTLAIVVHVDAGQTTTQQVVTALNHANAAGTIPFTASLDPVDGAGAGSIPIGVTPNGQVAATASGGGGQPLDQTSGLQIVNGGSAYNIDISQCRTVQDLLNTINGAGAGVLAGINQAGTGIQVQSRLSGCDFSIGENGGATATQLGLRTLSADTPLSDLNYGQGVSLGQSTAGGSDTAQDFTITRADGVSMTIDLSGCQTIGDVLNSINSNAQNTPAVFDGPPALVAQLSPQGNGIELVDDSVGTGKLTVSQASGSGAAVDLGLIPAGQTSRSASAASAAASATVTFPGGNNDLVFSSRSDTFGNGWKVVFQDTANPTSFDFDAAKRVMTFDINEGVTTANDILSMFDANAQAKADFSLSLSATDGGANDGTATVADNTAAPAVLSGGTPQTFAGSDPNPQEVAGLFTARSAYPGRADDEQHAGDQPRRDAVGRGRDPVEFRSGRRGGPGAGAPIPGDQPHQPDHAVAIEPVDGAGHRHDAGDHRPDRRAGGFSGFAGGDRTDLQAHAVELPLIFAGPPHSPRPIEPMCATALWHKDRDRAYEDHYHEVRDGGV